MKTAAKLVLPVVVGAMAGMAMIQLAERLLQLKYPLPPGLSLRDAVAAMPVSAFAFLLLGYSVASLCAGLVATMVSGRENIRPAIIVGIIITSGGVFNNISVPGQPQWFSIISLLAYLPFAMLGYLLVRKRDAQGD